MVLPYYPTGTMERVTKEGVVATARSRPPSTAPGPPSHALTPRRFGAERGRRTRRRSRTHRISKADAADAAAGAACIPSAARLAAARRPSARPSPPDDAAAAAAEAGGGPLQAVEPVNPRA